VTGSILPGSTNIYTLGNNTSRWYSVTSTGFSGSLTRLSDGTTNYLQAGSNINISTGSNGSITISNTAPTFYQWNELSPSPRLNTTASVSIAGGLGSSYSAQSVGTDVFFFVSGSTNTTSGVSVFGGDLLVSGTLEAQTISNVSSNNTTTSLAISGSTRGTTAAGRGVAILGAAGTTTINAGNVTVSAGNSGGSSSTAGSVTIQGGGSTTSSASAGSVTLSAGDTTGTTASANAGNIAINAGSLPSSGTGTAGRVDITTGAANSATTPGNITLTAQRGKVVLKQSTATVTPGNNVFLYVTGTIGGNDRSLFAGDVYVSGTIFAASGISGSLTRLTDGTNYIQAGSNITTSTGSNGSVTISATGLALSTSAFVTVGNDPNLSAERSLTAGSGLALTDDGANSSITLSINDGIVATVSGTTFTGVTKHNAGLSGSLTRLTDGTPYLVAGTNIQLSTGSNGAVTITNSATGASYVAGSNTQVQFNNGSGFGASSNFTFDTANNLLRVTNISGSLTSSNISAGQVVVAGAGGVLSGSNNFWWDNTTARVGIGTSSPGFNLEVVGTFAATSKSFVIPHPIRPGWKLRYGSLEGPENGVYVRGESQTETIDLPDYWEPLVDPASITVQLTTIGKWQSLYVESIENNRVKIGRGWLMRLLGIKPRYFYTITANRRDETFSPEYEVKR
jgi:hypothetical protein